MQTTGAESNGGQFPIALVRKNATPPWPSSKFYPTRGGLMHGDKRVQSFSAKDCDLSISRYHQPAGLAERMHGSNDFRYQREHLVLILHPPAMAIK